VKHKAVLLVEDSESDVKLVKRAFKIHGFDPTLNIASDGRQAKSLIDQMPDEHRPPDLILLDLKLPIANGIEVLDHVRASKATANVPVVVMTSSDEPEDVKRCYEHGANAYVRKLNGYDEYMEMMLNLGRFWLKNNLSCPSDC
jgi:CheY-like chemotaxis protein